MYLHVAMCNTLFPYLSMFSTYLGIFDSVRQAGKGDKEQDGKE